jgi:hypothetical protein
MPSARGKNHDKHRRQLWFASVSLP